jgi:hypothetical protein
MSDSGKSSAIGSPPPQSMVTWPWTALETKRCVGPEQFPTSRLLRGQILLHRYAPVTSAQSRLCQQKIGGNGYNHAELNTPDADAKV